MAVAKMNVEFGPLNFLPCLFGLVLSWGELTWLEHTGEPGCVLRKREERLRKVLQTRERAEEMEKERKRRLEQKIALLDEKTEKVKPLQSLFGTISSH